MAVPRRAGARVPVGGRSVRAGAGAGAGWVPYTAEPELHPPDSGRPDPSRAGHLGVGPRPGAGIIGGMTSSLPLLPPHARVFVAGHRGLVGSAVVRRLTADGHEVLTRGRAELDLRDAAATEAYLKDVRPDAVVLAAAKVGGIMANSTYPVQFLEDNLKIQLSVIAGSHAAGVNRLLFLGSSCIYPKLAPQPISEDALLTGPLEPTNEAYALAKIAGIVQVQSYRKQYGASYISAMPTNLYGPGDNFDLQSSHVLPALIRRFHEAAAEGRDEVTLWGSGTPAASSCTWTTSRRPVRCC